MEWNAPERACGKRDSTTQTLIIWSTHDIPSVLDGRRGGSKKNCLVHSSTHPTRENAMHFYLFCTLVASSNDEA